MSVLSVNPATTQLFKNNTLIPIATINNRLYLIDSEAERDQFDNYWNHQPASMQDGNGCRTMFIAGAISLFIITLVLSIFLSSCATQAPTLDKNRGKKVKPTLAGDTVTHRPRYNHWAKPYKLYAPVPQHNPHPGHGKSHKL